MKLTYIANIRLPTEKAHGVGRMKLCEAFAKQGIEVELIHPWRFNKIKKGPFDYYGVKRNFRIKKLHHLDFIPLDKFLGPLASWIGSLEFSFISFCYILTRGFFRSNIVFFSHDHFPLFLFSFFSQNTFYDIHDFPRLKTFLHKFYYQLLFKRLKGIVVTNSWKKKELENIFGIVGKKILIAPNGVDIEEFDISQTKADCRRKLGLSLKEKIILYTGHLYFWKGVQVLAEASQYLPKDVKVYFVGGTKVDIKNYKLQTANYELNIVGHKPHKEIPYWLKTADVLVLPNTAKEDISKYWTCPLKLFEYMVSKRPIVASNLPSIREILNESNSVLVKPDDPESLASGIIKVLAGKTLAEKISDRAYEDVMEYTWDKRAKKILEFLGRED